MTPELESLLCQRYPKIFAMGDLNTSNPMSHWGIECGDGWFDLINDLCHQIQAHVDSTDAEQIIASQIKEKYGELRFYYTGSDDAVDEMVNDAESRSVETCEYCGRPGQITEGQRGWLRTRCVVHKSELRIQKAPTASHH